VIDVPYTFQCREMLFVLGRMRPAPGQPETGTVTQAAMELANELKRNVIVVDDQELLVELDEPVEAVAIARALELRVSRCVAAPLAMELLRESGGPAKDAWDWLRGQLKLQHDLATGIVKLEDVDRATLPPNVDTIPDGKGVLLWIIHGLDDRVEFTDREIVIGRQGDLVIDDSIVSRTHARIVARHGTWAIENQSATHATYADGRPIRSRCLVPGMTIGVGPARIVVLSVR
jgi:hypothetical protein